MHVEAFLEGGLLGATNLAMIEAAAIEPAMIEPAPIEPAMVVRFGCSSSVSICETSV
jgi:hypothetical protein